MKIKASYRIYILAGIFCLISLFYIVLMGGIILTGEKPVSKDHTYTYVTVQAARGQIYDRNGVPLVTNRYIHNLVIDDQTLPDDDYDRNVALLTLLQAFNNSSEAGKRVTDLYPFTGTYPDLSYAQDVYYDTTMRYRLLRRIAANEIEDGVDTHTVSELEKFYAEHPEEFPTPEEIVTFLMKKYGLDEQKNKKNLYTDVQIEALLHLYYDMECNNFGGLNQYVLAKDITLSLITKVEEKSIPGAAFTYTVERNYEYPGYASHILGTIGQIYAEDWEYYKQQGYNMNDIVGISGCEYAFESYLRGTSGTKVLEFDAKGNLVKEYYESTPMPGKDVYLTIDINLQMAAEDGLAENVKYIRDNGYNRNCQSGALVAMDPDTGDVLAIASYPSFDLTTYNKNYSELYADPAQPLYNRALQGLYAPGSTFKLGMVVAGIGEGIVTPQDKLLCNGIYTYYSGYQPKCWTYPNKHGYINATEALRVSCNCYFYDLGRQLGITRMNQYCHFYGLGQHTGIELYEEIGILAGEEYREQNGLTTWQPGDTIAAAIGQSDNTFTPIQITSYLATVLNGGTRYKAHLLGSVKTYFTNETVMESKPQVLSEMNIADVTSQTLYSAMEQMVDTNATASRFMKNIPVPVGGKTGTAQLGGNLTDNALFVCSAPAYDPEIVLTVVIDKGAGGSYASLAAARVLEAYYGVEN